MELQREMSAQQPANAHDRHTREKSRELCIPAYIVEPPDLALHTSIINLLWYSVDCINSLPSISGKNVNYGEHFITCISRLDALSEKELSSLDEQIRKLLLRFLEEARKVSQLLTGFLEKAKSEQLPDSDVFPHSIGGALTAKATYLQWLAVCIFEELKIPFGDGDQRQTK
jgi:hypothetical protein